MKVTKKEHQPEFKPVTIEITFETEREYQLMKQFLGDFSKEEVLTIANNNHAEPFYLEFNKDDNFITKHIYNAL